MTPLFLSPSLPQVDEEGGERGAEGLGGGGREGGEEVIGTSVGTREMLNMKIISDRLVLDGRNVFESKTFLPKPRSYSATQMTWLGFSSTFVPNSYAAASKRWSLSGIEPTSVSRVAQTCGTFAGCSTD